MTARLLVVILGVAALAAPARAAVDHLQCFRVADPLTLKGVIDVDAPAVGATLAGCKLGRARLFCVPATTSVTTANVPVQPIAGRPLLDNRICYALHCAGATPFDRGLVDQFGTRTVTKLRPRLLCTPAVKGPPLPPQDTLDETVCYEIKDPVALKAHLTLDSPQFGTAAGCRAARARRFCTGAHTTIKRVNVAQLLPIDGTSLDDDRLCYPLTCPKPFPGPRVVSDQFRSRTLTGLKPSQVCTPVRGSAVTTATTSTTSTTPTSTVTTTTFPIGTDQALVCQRAIETGGLAYANALLDAVGDCTQPGQSTPLSSCLAGDAVQSSLSSVRAQWAVDTTAACPGVNLRSTLGYPETCAAAPSTCTFASPTLDAPGSRNDVLDCLACRIGEHLTGAAVAMFANRATTTSCSGTLGNGTLTVLRSTLQALDTCSHQPGATSVAACFSGDMTVWRTQAESSCAGVNPFTELGYPSTCSGREPVFPNSPVFRDPPCTFSLGGRFSATGGGENDLLDCLECRTQEAVLAVGRDLHGANLCCTGATCNKVLTRFVCRNVGGTPARYHIDSLPVAGGNAHGLDIAPDGSLLIANSSTGHALRVSPGGVVTDLGFVLGFPVGIAGDAAGNVYVTNRCSQTVVKIAPNLTQSVFAGTGVAGSSGDGGPATAAQITAPDGVTVDAAGKVYFTESFLLSFLCGAGGPGTERVRMVDTNGVIHTVAGMAPFGTAGEGGPATAAQLSIPYGLRIGHDGRLLVGEAGGQRVVRIESNGVLVRVAGRPLTALGAHSGYGGPATLARFYENCGVAQDPDGNVVISPMENNRVALVDTLGSVIGIAGTGEASNSGPSGDGGPAVLATVGLPEDIVVGLDGKVYVSDLLSGRIRVLTREPF